MHEIILARTDNCSVPFVCKKFMISLSDVGAGNNSEYVSGSGIERLKKYKILENVLERTEFLKRMPVFFSERYA